MSKQRDMTVGARVERPFQAPPAETAEPSLLFPGLLSKHSRLSHEELTDDYSLQILLYMAPKEIKDIFFPGSGLDHGGGGGGEGGGGGRGGGGGGGGGRGEGGGGGGGGGDDEDDERGAEGLMRTFIEHLSASIQCERAVVPFNSATTACWICGCLIGKETKACEHILPALRATMFSGLISIGKINEEIRGQTQSTHSYTEFVRRAANNYLWSHQTPCNSPVKGSMVLITFDPIRKEFIPDKQKIILLDAKLKKALREKSRAPCYEGYRKNNKEYKSGFIPNNGIDVYNKELSLQCVSINEEFSALGNSLPEMAKYALCKVELYFRAQDKELMMTPAERRALGKDKKEQFNNEIIKNYNLLKESITALRTYYEKNFVQIANSKASLTDDQMDLVVRRFITRYNLYSEKDDSMFGTVKGVLNTPVVEKVMGEMNMPTIISLILVIVEKKLYESPDRYSLINSTEYLDEDKRIFMRYKLYKLLSGSRQESLNKTVAQNLFISEEQFNEHISEHISWVFIQHILHLMSQGHGAGIINPSDPTIQQMEYAVRNKETATFIDHLYIKILEDLRPILIILNMNSPTFISSIRDKVYAKFRDSGVNLSHADKPGYSSYTLRNDPIFKRFCKTIKRRFPSTTIVKCITRYVDLLKKKLPDTADTRVRITDVESYLKQRYIEERNSIRNKRRSRSRSKSKSNHISSNEWLGSSETAEMPLKHLVPGSQPAPGGAGASSAWHGASSAWHGASSAWPGGLPYGVGGEPVGEAEASPAWPVASPAWPVASPAWPVASPAGGAVASPNWGGAGASSAWPGASPAWPGASPAGVVGGNTRMNGGAYIRKGRRNARKTRRRA